MEHTPATPLPWHQDHKDVCAWTVAPTVPKQEEFTVAECRLLPSKASRKP